MLLPTMTRVRSADDHQPCCCGLGPRHLGRPLPASVLTAAGLAGLLLSPRVFDVIADTDHSGLQT